MNTLSATALYDALKQAVEMTDSAPAEDNAIRAVVVLTDGQANVGDAHLDDIINMMSKQEKPITDFRGFQDDNYGVERVGRLVSRQDIIGTGSALETKHAVQIFFIGIGQDADMEVGRMLAQATGAEFQGVANDVLAQVLEEFSKYF